MNVVVRRGRCFWTNQIKISFIIYSTKIKTNKGPIKRMLSTLSTERRAAGVEERGGSNYHESSSRTDLNSPCACGNEGDGAGGDGGGGDGEGGGGDGAGDEGGGGGSCGWPAGTFGGNEATRKLPLDR